MALGLQKHSFGSKIVCPVLIAALSFNVSYPPLPLSTISLAVFPFIRRTSGISLNYLTRLLSCSVCARLGCSVSESYGKVEYGALQQTLFIFCLQDYFFNDGRTFGVCLCEQFWQRQRICDGEQRGFRLNINAVENALLIFF